MSNSDYRSSPVVRGSRVFDDATYWDYTYDQDTCPDCGGAKRKISRRCQSCEAIFRSSVYNSLQEYLKGVADHKSGKKVVLRFIFNG